MEEKILKFIDWVEGNYIPETEEEETELYAFGQRAYPYLMELQHFNS